MWKVLVVIVLLLVLIPVVHVLWPRPFTFERVQEVFEQKGFSVANVVEIPTPLHEAWKQRSMTINGAKVNVCQYLNEGKLVKAQEFLTTDLGTAMVESWGLREALGAAKPSYLPMSVGRNRMFLLTIESEDAALRGRVVGVFRSI